MFRIVCKNVKVFVFVKKYSWLGKKKFLFVFVFDSEIFQHLYDNSIDLYTCKPVLMTLAIFKVTGGLEEVMKIVFYSSECKWSAHFLCVRLLFKWQKQCIECWISRPWIGPFQISSNGLSRPQISPFQISLNGLFRPHRPQISPFQISLNGLLLCSQKL